MQYAKAPITEAIIELRYKDPLDQATIEKLAKAFSVEYIFDEPLQNIDIKMGPAGATLEVRWLGKKLSSLDRTDILVVGVQSFLCSRLAPYTGWEEFSGRAKRGWDACASQLGNRDLALVGVRFVNRIDIPIENDRAVDIKDYLNVHPASPDFGGAMAGYTMQTVRSLGVEDCFLSLTSAAVPSPLVGFASFLLDLTVYREQNLPRRSVDIWVLLDRIREHKNRVFELSVTDLARKLFQ